MQPEQLFNLDSRFGLDIRAHDVCPLLVCELCRVDFVEISQRNGASFSFAP